MSQEIKQKCAVFTSATVEISISDSERILLEKRKKEAAEPIYLDRF